MLLQNMPIHMCPYPHNHHRVNTHSCHANYFVRREVRNAYMRAGIVVWVRLASRALRAVFVTIWCALVCAGPLIKFIGVCVCMHHFRLHCETQRKGRIYVYTFVHRCFSVYICMYSARCRLIVL